MGLAISNALNRLFGKKQMRILMGEWADFGTDSNGRIGFELKRSLDLKVFFASWEWKIWTLKDKNWTSKVIFWAWRSNVEPKGQKLNLKVIFWAWRSNVKLKGQKLNFEGQNLNLKVKIWTLKVKCWTWRSKIELKSQNLTLMAKNWTLKHQN